MLSMATVNQTSLGLPPTRQTLNKITHHHHEQLLTILTTATSLTQLKQVHTQILRTNPTTSTFLLLKLVTASSTLSSTLDYSLSIFNQISDLQPHQCNPILREFSKSKYPEKTLLVYEKMRKERIGIDRFSLPPILKALSRVSAMKQVMEIHGVASKMGLDSDPYVQTGLMKVYAACGCILEARLVFDKMLYRDVVTWSVMMDSYSQRGLYDDVLRLFVEMQTLGEKPDAMVLCTILSAYSHTGNLNSGKAIHDYISQNNIAMDAHLQSSLITMYTNCGSMDLAQNLYDKMSLKNVIVSTTMVMGYSKLGKIEAARSIFDGMVEKDLISWSAMISGYAESNSPQEALKLFNEMHASGLRPDRITMLSVISACAQLGTQDEAKWVHTFVDNNGFRDVLSINNALIDMYAKCGSMHNAWRIFNNMPNRQRNVISWTSMITALAMHGEADTAFRLFDQMKANRIEPNSVTFISLLYACSHAGLVDKGRQIFASMANEYNIIPQHEHYGCMVDLLGRANLIRESLQLIESMPLAPNVVIWGSFLSACRVHGEVELGELAAKKLLELNSDHDGAHVLLSNIYAKARRFGDVGEVRKFMKDKGISKERGCSKIELNGHIHEFLMLDKTHKQSDQIYEKLDKVVSKLKLAGYAPDSCSVLVDVEEEEKKDLILWHSEKLALCYGLMSSDKESCIHIVKNLRVCEDCHTFMKLVSKVFEREILVRDRTRFHHYKDGSCSCKDYW